MDNLNDMTQPNIGSIPGPNVISSPNPPAPNKNKILIIALSVAVLVVAGSALGYFVYTKYSPANTTPPATIVTPKGDEISWQKPQEIADMKLWAPSESSDIVTKYYKIGTFSNGKYQGGDIILADQPCEGPCFRTNYFRMVKTQSVTVMLAKYSDPLLKGDGWIKEKFSVDADYVIPALDFPQVFIGPQPNEALEIDSDVREFFDSSKLTKLFTDSKLGDVFKDANIIPSSPTAGATRNGFYIQAPDGTLRSYALRIDFVNKNVPSVTWNGSDQNYTEYFYTDLTGCGSSNYISVMPISKVNPTTDLAPTGKTSKGDNVYGLKDTNHPLLKDVYDNQYQVYQQGQQKLSYTDFLKQHPLFFWTDPFGRLIKFQNNSFVPPFECGKPVIYLYPEKPTDIRVKIYPKGGMTYSEPVYNENTGWFVNADTQSNLTNKISGESYPYLFWEGRGGIYEQPKSGFVIEKEAVHPFLVEKLTILGLNKKEIGDFTEFWEPRMQSSPYYFITFLGNTPMNQIAPLDITPTPNTIIRILMDFSPLKHPVVVQEPILATPHRSGFTVVEWGGVIR